MAEVRRFALQSRGRYTWPVAEANFTDVVYDVSQSIPYLRATVGFRANTETGYPTVPWSRPSEVAWIKYKLLRSKYPGDNAMVSHPKALDRYMRDWKEWWAALPARFAAPPLGPPLASPPAGRSVIDDGFFSCPQFELAPTMKAFIEGVTRALLYTPLFSLTAMLLFLRDVYLCYAALYTLVAIIIIVLGLLGMLGLSLGPIESLSFAVVIGVSVDYLVHFAYAFKHSLMPEQFYKSRAALFARSGSTLASGFTTLCAVLPLLGATILPLHIFGIIFSVVALVSLAIGLLFFNALLMVTGPGAQTVLASTALPPPRADAAKVMVTCCTTGQGHTPREDMSESSTQLGSNRAVIGGGGVCARNASDVMVAGPIRV